MTTNQQPIKNNHKVLLKCDYCNKQIIENVFKVTRQSKLIWKLMNSSDPISQHLEPKICCHACYLIYLHHHYPKLKKIRAKL